MRKVTFGVANSLDNQIAREDHATDWLRWSPEAGAITRAFWKTIDTVLMGRKTYEIAPAAGYPGVKNYVFSRSVKRSRDPRVELVTGDAAAFVKKLKDQQGKDICVMGGGELAHVLLEADLVDEIGLNIQPIILGAGVPLFHRMTRSIDLELLACKPIENGCVYVSYRVIHRER